MIDWQWPFWSRFQEPGRSSRTGNKKPQRQTGVTISVQFSRPYWFFFQFKKFSTRSLDPFENQNSLTLSGLFVQKTCCGAFWTTPVSFFSFYIFWIKYWFIFFISWNRILIFAFCWFKYTTYLCIFEMVVFALIFSR